MMNLSTYAANSLLDGSDTMPSTLYLGGHIGNPGPDGLLDVAGETRRLGFTRTAAVAGEATQDTLATMTNAAATESWTHFVLWDAPSGGNPWWIGEFPSPVAITATETIRLQADTITMALSIWS